jgi:hypothetical protein
VQFVVVAVAVATSSIACGGAERAEPPGQSSPALSPAQAPCVELVTVQEVQSLGRKDVLIKVDDEQPGSSICVWVRVRRGVGAKSVF